ncbi:putative gustatory receptor 39b [Eurosta solidaginis]|uniref:putative gustatory receptor 39b n=1 Tax=Eurosta solidaginis TaxID=178769 RepID=UPI003530D81C
MNFTNLTQNASHMSTVSAIIGQVNQTHSNEAKGDQQSTKIDIYLLICVLCAIYIHGLHWRNLIPGLMLTWIASTIIFTCQVGTNFIIIYEAMHKQTEHENFLTLLDEIEVSLKLRLNLNVQQMTLLKCFRFHIISHIVIAIIPHLLYVITSVWLNYTGYFLHGLWSILTLRIRIVQVLIYVRILRHYLECLCVKMRQIEVYRRAPQQRMLDVNYERLDSLECLFAVKDIYALLHRAFVLLNSFAGWSLFCTVTSYLFDTSANLYWTLLSFDGYVRRRYYNIAGVAVIAPLIIIILHLCYLLAFTRGPSAKRK